MPGFFEGMRRLIVGEPVYRPGENADSPIYQHADESKSEQQATVANYDHDSGVADDKAHPPQAVIERFECYLHDEQHMEVNVHIRNQSDKLLWIDKLMLFGQRFNITHDLEPGEVREFMVYNGPMMDNKFYTESELHYRTPEGDYFSARHNVEYEEKPNHKYIPHRMRFYGPVKDI